MGEMQRNEAVKPTRREMLLLGSAAAAGSVLLTSACKSKERGVVATMGDQWCKSHPRSVFCATYPSRQPNITSSGPKDSYDALPAYGFFAIWLMFTTEDWEKCLANVKWRKPAAGDLGVYPPYFTRMYEYANSTPAYSKALATVKEFWKDFRANTLGFASPYPGGGVLLQLAWDFDPNSSQSTFLSEYCGGAEGSADLSKKTSWPLSLWLMLTTNNFWLKNWLSDASIAPGIWQQFNMNVTDQHNAQIVIDWAASSGKSALGYVQDIWDQQFLPSIPANVYGGKPCAGPPTLVQIANGGNK